MGTRLFVGNLSYNVNEQELKEVFQSEKIEVRSVRVAVDRETGRPRGFAFVETETEDGAKQSIEKLGGRLVQGRAIIIEEAQARPGGGGGVRPVGGPRPGGGPSGPPRPGFGPRPGSGPGGPRPGGPPPMGPGGPPRSFGPPKPGPTGFDSRGPDRPPGNKPDGRRERPEKKRSTRPKPEERERGNWHWSGILDDD
jgi:RNA recognition motif-containing protein